MTGFRGRTLDMAKKNARLYGFRGAHFPWETATTDGHDACVAPTDWSEHHIYLVGRGDGGAGHEPEFNLETAFPVVSAVANWPASRGQWTDDWFEVLHMGGPDESLGQVNDSNLCQRSLAHSLSLSLTPTFSLSLSLSLCIYSISHAHTRTRTR